MQDKQKVTLYLPADLHRQLKIHAAATGVPMSDLAERAISFYLAHGALVESAYGHTHRVYTCPSCTESMVIREGELFPLNSQGASGLVVQDQLGPHESLITC